MRKGVDRTSLIGFKNDRLEVISFNGPGLRKSTRGTTWKCKCDCGKELILYRSDITKRKRKSCGCLRAEGVLTFKGHNLISGTYWRKIRVGAKERKIPFDLTIEQAWELFESQERKCALSGVDIVLVRNSSKKYINQTASLDRIDSSKGYSLDNLQWVHKTIQRMKCDYDEQDFIDFCRNVAQNAAIKDRIY